MSNGHVLGIIGGLGPMAGAYFYELLIELTDAGSDQEHIDVVLSGRATTPDRTAYITGMSDENPLGCMRDDAMRLVGYGADILAMPCNTAHYFYDELHGTLPVPLINIIDVTVRRVLENGCTRVGIMATEGTVSTGTYQKKCAEYGLGCIIPSEMSQKKLNKIIYGDIKSGNEPDMDAFCEVAAELTGAGCTKIILGCTELSLIMKTHSLSDLYVDSLRTLAEAAVTMCGKQVRHI